MSVEVDNLVTYLIVICNNKTSSDAAERVMCRKVLQVTITFILNVRGVNVLTITQKIAKLHCVKYYTSYTRTLYYQKGTHVLGVEEKCVYRRRFGC